MQHGQQVIDLAIYGHGSAKIMFAQVFGVPELKDNVAFLLEHISIKHRLQRIRNGQRDRVSVSGSGNPSVPQPKLVPALLKYYIRAVNEAPKRELEQLSDACRDAVFPELQTAKIRYFSAHADDVGNVPCAFTGNPISASGSALEYVQTSFVQIVKAYADAQGWAAMIPSGVLSEPGDAQTITVFISPEHATAFRQFHRASAKICVLSKENRGLCAIGPSAQATLLFLEL